MIGSDVWKFIIPIVIILFMGGCLNPFAPQLTESIESSDLIVTGQTSPDDVIQNFKVAYTFRDSLLYSDLLDTAFVFRYYDPDEGTSGRYVSWKREEDLRITGRLFRHFQVINLVWDTKINEQIGEKTAEITRGYDLKLFAEESDYQFSGRAVFSFQECADKKWRITRWTDVSDL